MRKTGSSGNAAATLKSTALESSYGIVAKLHNSCSALLTLHSSESAAIYTKYRNLRRKITNIHCKYSPQSSLIVRTMYLCEYISKYRINSYNLKLVKKRIL